MPLYDYRCVDCGSAVEVMHGIHDAGPAACQACGGTMRKALSPPAIHFKGSGWAKKDARSGSAKVGGTSSSSGDEKAETKTGDAGDSAGQTTSGKTDAPSAKAGAAAAKSAAGGAGD